MPVRTTIAGNRDKVITGSQNGVFDIEILDGLVGWVLEDEDTDRRSGERVDPSDVIKVDSLPGEEFFLEAETSDLEYQVLPAGKLAEGQRSNPLSSKRPMKDRVRGKTQTGGKSSLVRPLARVINTTPGADTNIQVSGSDLDITVPGTGTIMIRVQLDTDAIVKVVESGFGATITQELNNGQALDAGEVFTFTLPCRSDATYNFQVDTAGVEVDILQLDYTRQVVN